MMRFDDMTVEEQKNVSVLFSNWLKCYTHDIIVNVIAKRDEIINNTFVMDMLRELKEREERESNEFTKDIRYLLMDYDAYKEFDPHIHPLTHSNSYRDILYDMYIRN